MSKSFNMKETKTTGGDFAPIPNGRYSVKSTAAEKTIVASSGSDMVQATFTIFGENYANRKLWDNFVWDENSAWKVKSILEASNSPLVDDEELTLAKFMKALNNGLSFSTYVEIKSYKGKDGQTRTKNAMKNFMPLTDDAEQEETESIFK